MNFVNIFSVTLSVIGTSLIAYIPGAQGALTVTTPHAPLATTIEVPVNFAYTPNWYVVYDPTETFGLGLQPYVTLGGTFLSLQCNGAGVLAVNQNPGSDPLSFQASTGTATMNFGLTAGLNLEFMAFGDTLSGSLNIDDLPNNGDLGFYDSQSFSSYLLDSPVVLSSTISPTLVSINTLDALTAWFGIVIPDWLAGIDLDINADVTIGQSIQGESISTSAGTVSSEGQTLNANVSGPTYELQNVQETWQDTTSLTLGLSADLTASLLLDTVSVTLVNFGDVPLITNAITYPLTSDPIPSLQFDINATTATSISLNCNVSPNQNVAPGSPVTVSGTAVYNNGEAVPAGTVTISVGGQTWTAAIANGTFSRTITAPTSSGTYTVSCSATDGAGNAGSSSPSLSVQPNGSGSNYSLNGFLTCQYVNPNSPYNYTGATTAFSGTNAMFYVWTELDNVYGSHTVDIQLYRPNGSYYNGFSTSIPNAGNGQSYPWYRIYADWHIAGYDIGNTPGTWTLQLVIDGTYIQSTSFVMRYQFAQHLMCQDVQSSSPYNPINPNNVFKQTDAKATAWGSLLTVSDALQVQWLFYEPSGSQYGAPGTYSIPSPLASGYSYWNYYNFWCWLDISGNGAANKCGNWHVDVYLSDVNGNFQKQYTDYFTILEDPPVPPAANVSATPASPQAGQSITLNVACSDNTYLQEAVLFWNDGSLHSNVWNNIIAGTFNESQVIGPYSAGQQVQYWVMAADTSGNATESGQNTLTIMPVSGSLQVNISPQAAIDAGAEWQVDAGAWQNTGVTVPNVIVGSNIVSFKSIQGWITPNNQTVVISAEQTNMVAAAYVQEPQPSLFVSLASLSRTIAVGQNASSQSFQVGNAGSGTLNYTIGTTAAWLSVSPTNGGSTGEVDLIQVNYSAAALGTGVYSATIAVIAPGTTNSPQTINVNLTVIAPPVLSLTRTATQLTLNWAGLFQLQYCTNLTDAVWINVATTNAPFVTSLSGQNVFYRLSSGTSSSSPMFEWVDQATGTGSGQACGVTVDSTGNIYMTGLFEGALDFGTNGVSSSNALDMCTVKFDSQGNAVWATQGIGAPPGATASGNGIATDTNANCFVVGGYHSLIGFGTNTLTGGGTFVVKYDTDGNVLWAFPIPSWGAAGYGVAVDNLGNCYVTGAGTAKLSSDGIEQWEIQTPGLGIAVDGMGNCYIADAPAASSGNLTKCTSEGSNMWTVATVDMAYAVAADSSGNSYVTGPGTSPFYLAKYDTNGTNLWVQPASGSVQGYGRSVAVDGAGNVLVCGSFTGTANFGGANTLVCSGGADIFVAKYDPSGNLIWAKQAGGSAGQDIAFGIAAGAGEVGVTGQFTSSATFDALNISTTAGRQIFVAKLPNQ
jgi:hypothetical protein